MSKALASTVDTLVSGLAFCSRLYVDRAPPHFYPTTLRAMLLLNSRLYTTALRPFNIVPGFSPYTRLQAVAS